MSNRANVLRLFLTLIFCVLSLNGYAQVPEEGGRNQKSSEARLKLAVQYYQASLIQDPSQSRHYMKIAQEEIARALAFDPNNAKAHGLVGLIYKDLKKYPEADDAFNRALRIAPEDSQINNNYGFFLCETGNYKKSLQYFMKSVADPLYDTPEIAYFHAGRCSLLAGNDFQAEQYLKRAMGHSSEIEPLVSIQMAKIFYVRGDFEKSRSMLGDVLKRFDAPTPEALLLGIRLARKFNSRSDEKSYEQALRNRYPNSQEYQDLVNGKLED